MIVASPEISDDEWCSEVYMTSDEMTDAYADEVEVYETEQTSPIVIERASLSRSITMCLRDFDEALGVKHDPNFLIYDYRARTAYNHYHFYGLPPINPVSPFPVISGLEVIKAQSEVLSRIAVAQAAQGHIAYNLPILVRRRCSSVFKHFCRVMGRYDGPACPPPYALDYELTRSAASFGSTKDNSRREMINDRPKQVGLR
jgi:hypothetical protein